MADFPHASVPILLSACSEEYIPPETRIAQSVSHKEARDCWGATFRRRWTINLRVLEDVAASAIVSHYLANGTATTFNFTSPRGDGTYLCRYESATLSLAYAAPAYWPAKVSIIQVI